MGDLGADAVATPSDPCTVEALYSPLPISRVYIAARLEASLNSLMIPLCTKLRM